MVYVNNNNDANSEPIDYFSEEENTTNKKEKSWNDFTKQVKLEAPLIQRELNIKKEKLSFRRIIFWIVLIISIFLFFSGLVFNVSDEVTNNVSSGASIEITSDAFGAIVFGLIIWIVIGSIAIGVAKRDVAEVKLRYDRAKKNDDIRHDERVRIKERRRYSKFLKEQKN